MLVDRGKQAIKRRISLNGDSFLHKAFVIVIIRTAQIVAPDVSGRLIVIITVPIVQEISTVEDETTRLYVLKFSRRQAEKMLVRPAGCLETSIPVTRRHIPQK